MTGLSQTAGPPQLFASSTAERPSLVLDAFGRPAVAWVEQGGNSFAVRTLRAVADPSVSTNWKSVDGGSTTPDTLGTAGTSATVGSASLARMPASSPATLNDNALYVFWSESTNQLLYGARARVSGSSYTAWASSPADAPAAKAGPTRLSTAADPAGGGILLSYHDPAAAGNRLRRKQASNDANANDAILLGSGGEVGQAVSLGVDRGGAITAFARTATGQLAYRRYLPGVGWDADATLLDGDAGNDAPAAREDVADGQADVAWVKLNASNVYEVRHQNSRRRATGYAYDRLSRLTTVVAPTGKTTYAYDPVGNRTGRTRGGTPTSYSYDRADRITAAGSVSYTVDANGNLVARGADTFAYDQANRLTSATISGVTSTYGYDGDGKRTSRTSGGVRLRPSMT